MHANKNAEHQCKCSDNMCVACVSQTHADIANLLNVFGKGRFRPRVRHRGPLEGVVVQHHQLPVPRELDVELHAVDVHVERVPQAASRVLGSDFGPTPVRDDAGR